MDYQKMHATGLFVSRLCLGTMNFGGKVAPEEAIRMTHLALDAGVNFVDTANVYEDGRSEEIVGSALAGRRDKVILATKVCLTRHPERLNEAGLSRRSIIQAAEASLKRLNTDYIDLYYMHIPDPNTPIEETIDAMDGLVRAGKVRYIGVSNFASWQLLQAVLTARFHGKVAPMMSENVYNLLCRSAEDELVPCLRAHQVGMTVFNPLAGGMLTGKHTYQAPLPGSRFDNNSMYQSRYWNEESFRGVELLRPVAEAAGLSLTELAIRWCMEHDFVDSVILGASSQAQLAENLAVADLPPLSAQTLAKCDEMWSAISSARYHYSR